MTEENKTNEEHKKQQEEQKAKEEVQSEKPELFEEPIPVKDYIYLTLISLEGKAWAYMDLIVHPETQKHKKDLTEARLAIDAMDILYKTIEERLSPEQRKDIRTRLTNLRLNFAKK